MSGHSKWAKLKHTKGALDAKRGNLFTKIAHTITIAAREGGNDPASNFKLRLAIDKAKQANMPKENVERAIDRGLGKTDEGVIESATYEVFFPGKIAFVIEVLTDNKNRTMGELRRVINNYDGNFAQQGAVLWMFERRGVLRIIPPQRDPALAVANYPAEAGRITNLEDLELKIIDLGADDIQIEGDEIAIYTSPENLEKVKEGIEKKEIQIDYAEIEWFAKDPIEISPEQQKKIDDIFAKLDEISEINDYYTNIK